MTRFIIVRHGQSEGNAKGEFHGQYNSDLIPELGHEQAECTAEYVDRYTIELSIHAIFAAPIPRLNIPLTGADFRSPPIPAFVKSLPENGNG